MRKLGVKINSYENVYDKPRLIATVRVGCWQYAVGNNSQYNFTTDETDLNSQINLVFICVI